MNPDRSPSETDASQDEIHALLKNAMTIAVVGLSEKPDRDSFQVAKYLQQAGYRIIPVNPAVGEVLGEKSYASLAEIPGKIDIVDIFRKPEAIPAIVEEAVRIKAGAVWMQEGIRHPEAAKRAWAAGLLVVQSRCIMKEHCRI